MKTKIEHQPDEPCRRCGTMLVLHTDHKIIIMRSCPACGYHYDDTTKYDNTCIRCGQICDRRDLDKESFTLLQCNKCHTAKIAGDRTPRAEDAVVSLDDPDRETKLRNLAVLVSVWTRLMVSQDDDPRFWSGVQMAGKYRTSYGSEDPPSSVGGYG